MLSNLAIESFHPRYKVVYTKNTYAVLTKAGDAISLNDLAFNSTLKSPN